jgi:ankyrin repeat protein
MQEDDASMPQKDNNNNEDVISRHHHRIPEGAALPSGSLKDDMANNLSKTSSSGTAASITAVEIKPFASKLSDYLAPGGSSRYQPRAEWLNAATIPLSNGSGRRKRSRHHHEHPHQRQVPPAPPVPQVRPLVQEDPAQLHVGNNGLLPENAFADFLVAALVEPSADEVDIEAVETVVAAARTIEAAASSSGTTNHHRRSNSNGSENAIIFGKDKDSALHMAIRENSIDAALSLIQLGAPVGAENSKRVTPLILAAQKGLLQVVSALIKCGANPLAVTITGSTALLQASHFGHFEIVELLLQHGAMIEMANYKNTTPLMRASQEGHEQVVSLLLSRGARVNRRNNEHMSALMLASQRGHSPIVQQLLDHKADVDAMTAQKSTSLMLACKREHVSVVQVLVTSGCELQMKDSRGRTARDVATRRSSKTVLRLLEPPKQVELMQRKSRVERSYLMAKMWNLLQQDRASVYFSGRDVSIHQVYGKEAAGTVQRTNSSLALIRTMTLPAPMVEHIASFMPLPNLWDERLMLITRRCGVDADAAISCALDLIDEVLEEGGFLEACHIAKVTPPTHFKTWDAWRSWGCQHNNLDTTPTVSGRVNSLTATLPGMPRLQIGSISPLPKPMNARDWRRGVCFLQILAHRSAMLQRVLVQPPFKMPTWVVDQLITVSDIQSLSRRMGTRGAHFDPSVAIELVMLASSVVSWYNRELRCYDGQMAAIQVQDEQFIEEQANDDEQL